MSKKYDAVIIAAGIVSFCVAFEFTEKGYNTLNVDKLPDALAAARDALEKILQ